MGNWKLHGPGFSGMCRALHPGGDCRDRSQGQIVADVWAEHMRRPCPVSGHGMTASFLRASLAALILVRPAVHNGDCIFLPLNHSSPPLPHIRHHLLNRKSVGNSLSAYEGDLEPVSDVHPKLCGVVGNAHVWCQTDKMHVSALPVTSSV